MFAENRGNKKMRQIEIERERKGHWAPLPNTQTALPKQTQTAAASAAGRLCRANERPGTISTSVQTWPVEAIDLNFFH